MLYDGPTGHRLPQRRAAWLIGLAAWSAAWPATAAGDSTARPALAAAAPSTPVARPPGKTAAPPGHAAIDAALAADLLGWASRLSGLPNPPGEAMPRFLPLPQRDIEKAVCPERRGGCAALVAVYDTDRRRVLYRDTLDMRDPTDQSFIVHELVHHLQFLQRGDTLFSSCQSTLSGEAQAYRVQNLYQAQFRQWQRMGEILRYMHCEDSTGTEPVARLLGLPGQ
jgi:hypothetical protein